MGVQSVYIRWIQVQELSPEPMMYIQRNQYIDAIASENWLTKRGFLHAPIAKLRMRRVCTHLHCNLAYNRCTPSTVSLQ
jgi:hypothetical protein